ncbi:MAG: hypothetical protein HEP71_18070 [Roseivirga sp.]|nr:hypothetical protein [Roseivirga sp.]
MKRERKISTLIYLSLVFSMALMSCAGGHVSQNGLFEKDHKELKESLVGSWQVLDRQYGEQGQEIYEFYRDDKKVKLRVLGIEREIERFDSADGITFSFEYKIEEGKKIYVLGQFKSYQKKELLAMEELPDGLQKSLSMVKREKGVKTQ